MNKKYFCKYLPVEGEIKTGDIVKNKQGEFVHAVNPDDKRCKEVGIKKHKLFLCSRGTIQVDKPLWDKKSNIERTPSKITPGAVYFTNEPDGKKMRNMYEVEGKLSVIGEISPEAIWIKDGDEFDEEDVKLSEYPECPLCGAYGNDGFCPYDVDCQILKARIVVYIKGPCGYFH